MLARLLLLRRVPHSSVPMGIGHSQQIQRRLWPTMKVTRTSSSGVYQHFLHDNLRIRDLHTARLVINHFRPAERELLLQALAEQQTPEGKQRQLDYDYERDQPSRLQLRQLFIVNTIPFVGFGVLDNMIMILAGEYIDQQLGALFCISTMAAAALGNIISDVAGVGLAHYVEQFVSYVGIKHPVLTSAQLESKKARLSVNFARAFGLTVGCLIGMFPLLFFESPPEAKKEKCAVSGSGPSEK